MNRRMSRSGESHLSDHECQPVLTVSSSAAQRNIPPDIIFGASELPASFEEGAALLVDKPRGRTSFDIVEVVRKGTGVRKVGHAGTLDPMATGLLILLVGRPATRLQEAFMHRSKAYVGTMRLGETTPSLDTETEVVERSDVSQITMQDLEEIRPRFCGTIEQVPPMYSAIKVDGERLYKKARRGETVDRPPRTVQIDEFELLKWDAPDLEFRVRCSKGTYIRSLARDVGEVLKVGGHLSALRRTAIGPYTADTAWSLDTLQDALPRT